MDRFHDKANKLLNEVRKKKIKVGNINIRKDNKDREKKDTRNVSDLTHNSCLFCEKVFINSSYLMKHVYRRHSENLIKLHKRCLHVDSNDSSDLKSLFSFLEEEFLILKTELSNLKQSFGHKVVKNETNGKAEESSKESLEHVRHISKTCVDSENAVADIDSREIELLKEKVHNIESNIQCLHNKFEEFDSTMKTEVLFRQDMKKRILNEENFFREQETQFVELRHILLKELKSTLSKELSECNLKWKSKFTELKHDILRLDHIIAGLKKQIDSPDYFGALEKRLEQQIINFLGTTKDKAAKRRNSRVKNKLSLSKKHNTFQDIKMLETDNFDSQIINSSKPISVPVRHNLESRTSCISSDELSFLIAEKLSHFNISPTTSRLSNAEYENKLKLINSVKDSFNKKYHNFSEIYNNINTCADHRILSKLRCKKSKKLRFSEPLTSSKDISYNLRSNKADFFNKTCPVLDDENEHSESDFPKISSSDIKNSIVLEKHRFVTAGSEGFVFSDVGGSGECSGIFQDFYRNSVKRTFEPTSAKEYKTSSPIVDTHSSGETDCNIKKDNSFINLPVSSGSYKNIDFEAVGIQNTSHHMLDNYAKHEEPFSKSLKIYDKVELNDKSSELDDYDDKSSLESLSSWEDEENSLAKDGLQ